MMPRVIVPSGGWRQRVEARLARIDEEDCHAWAHLLDEAERLRSARFRRDEDRDRFILGRGLLRVMLGEALDLPPHGFRFGANSYGKPTLADEARWAFNVAHSGDCVLVGLAQGRAIGVDVEKHRTDVDLPSLCARMFTARERRIVTMADETERTAAFFRQWALKEALLKGIGTGFSSDPTRFDVSLGDPLGALTSIDGGWEPLSGWELHDLTITEGYAAAVAVLP